MRRINRRTCLKGLGVSLALPLLDSMGWAGIPAGKADKPPVRLGFMYMPHGVIMDQFWPANPESFLSSPPPALESLRPVLDQCLMMKGISGVPIAPFNGAPHALELSTWLTATLPAAEQAERDQHRHLRGSDRGQLRGRVHRPAVAGTGHDAADAQGEPGGAERGLLLALQLPFADAGGAGGDQSAQRAEPAVQQTGAERRATSTPPERTRSQHAGPGPRRRQGPAGGHCPSRTSTSSTNTSTACAPSNAASPPSRIARRRPPWRRPASSASKRHASDSPPIEIKIPEGDKRSEYMQVMCDLNVLAFQTDTTRVSTYIGSTPNGVSYPELGFNDEHHSQTHHNNEPEKVRKVAKITAFNIAQFAYMVKKMASLREGDGTLLDNCIMMWGSGLEDGNKHARENLPFIIAGKGGGSIKTGRFLREHEGQSGRPAHHAARLRRRPARPAHRHRDEADRGTQGSGVTNTVARGYAVRDQRRGRAERARRLLVHPAGEGDY